METIKIKGKDYVMVNERLKEFRKEHENYALVSEIVHMTDESCVIKATILDEKGRILATGHAQEDKTSSLINQTSFVENCETSAWGRALGNFGYGIDTSVASAEEMAMAVAKQDMQTAKEVIGGNYVMPSGKHKGTPISMIPDDYLDWYLQNGYDNYIKENIKMFKKDLYEREHEGLDEVDIAQGHSFLGE